MRRIKCDARSAKSTRSGGLKGCRATSASERSPAPFKVRAECDARSAGARARYRALLLRPHALRSPRRTPEAKRVTRSVKARSATQGL